MKQFAVSTKTTKENGDDLWETKRISFKDAELILIHNGWTENQARADLLMCPDQWILVNNCTQIC